MDRRRTELTRQPPPPAGGAQETCNGAAGAAHVPPPPADQAAWPLWRLVLGLAWPVLLQQFLVLTVGLSDRLLAGRFQPGDPADHVAYQAAQTTAAYLSWVISSFAVLATVGSTALVARFVGAGDRAAAVRAANQSILLAAALGLLGTAVGLAGTDPLLALLQLHGKAAAFAADYLRPLFLALTAYVVLAAGNACLVGAGDTRTGLCVLGGVALLNVPLAWGFFHGVGPLPGQGFAGIAVGTATANVLGALAVLTVLARGRAGLRLRLPLLRPDWPLLWRLLRVSVPAGIDSLSVAACQLWFLSIVNHLPYAESSAHGIALGWEAMSYLSGYAFGMAAMALVGQFLGAGRPRQAARAGWTAFGMGCAVMCLMGAVFYALAPQMFGLFCPDPEQRPVIAAGVPVLRLVALAMPALACSIVFTPALRGAGDTRVPVLFTWTGFLGVRIPLAYFLTLAEVPLGPLGTWPGLGWGLQGAWTAMVADVIVRGLFFLYRFASGRWQRIEV
ncbi:MAG TPA: MATE family efflux transporter [Gemmataceae bacterium]|nr:MATE family efflux transporter [Gemmataceae bacterium]